MRCLVVKTSSQNKPNRSYCIVNCSSDLHEVGRWKEDHEESELLCRAYAWELPAKDQRGHGVRYVALAKSKVPRRRSYLANAAQISRLERGSRGEPICATWSLLNSQRKTSVDAAHDARIFVKCSLDRPQNKEAQKKSARAWNGWCLNCPEI